MYHRIVYLLPLLVFLILALFLWRGLGQDPRHIPSALLNKPLPGFNLTTVRNAEKKMDNTQLIGRVALLNVWATWCIACRAEHSVLMDIARSKEVALYGVDYKDQRDRAQQWLQRMGNPYQFSVFDAGGQLGIDLGVYGTPETFLIDRKGVVRYKHVGPISPETWQDELLPRIKLLKQRRDHA